MSQALERFLSAIIIFGHCTVALACDLGLPSPALGRTEDQTLDVLSENFGTLHEGFHRRSGTDSQAQEFAERDFAADLDFPVLEGAMNGLTSRPKSIMRKFACDAVLKPDLSIGIQIFLTSYCAGDLVNCPVSWRLAAAAAMPCCYAVGLMRTHPLNNSIG